MRPIVFALLFVLPFPAWSASLANAALAYQSGDWPKAETLARTNGSADGLALAARAILTRAMIDGARQIAPARLKEARSLAERALGVDPRHIEGRLQLATALGMEARIVPPMMALADGLPQRARRLLVTVSRDAPDNAWAWALIGGWHIEAIRQGGAAAQVTLGANITLGKAAFTKALALDPTEPAIPFYYAASLLNLQGSATQQEIRKLLIRATNAKRAGAFQDAVRLRSREVLQMLDREGSTKAAILAAQFL